MRANEIVIRAEQRPGEASFNNYNEVKQYLCSELTIYKEKAYSLDNFREAELDLKVLRAVKKKLYDKRKELENAYKMPINEVLQQMDELIDMVKEPMNILDRFIKSHEKDIKERRIYEYAEQKSALLGKYAGKVLNSPAFFNPRWKNKSYSDKSWKSDVDSIIRSAKGQIETIVATGGEHTNALLGFYFEKLSMEGLSAFFDTLTKGVGEGHQDASESYESANQAGMYTIDPETGEVGFGETKDESDTMLSQSLESEKEDKSIIKIYRLRGTAANIQSYIAKASEYRIVVEEMEDKVRDVKGYEPSFKETENDVGTEAKTEGYISKKKKESCNICKLYKNETCGGGREICEDYSPTPQSFKGEPGAYGDATRFRLGGDHRNPNRELDMYWESDGGSSFRW